MIHHIFEFLKIVFVLAAIASIFYYVLCMWSAAAFLREQKTAGERAYPTPTLPGVSILKPLKGTDPEMYDSFRSHCVQDYPEYEILFGLGSTLAFRRRDLQTIGGFESFADYLADDHELGKRIAALGKEVKISDVVVETLLRRYTMREFLTHQLRWARTIRDARPWGYAGLGLTFGLPWALLAVAAAHGATLAWGLLIAVLAMRLGVMFAVGRRVLRDRQAVTMLPLLPLRDIVALLVWTVSFVGHTVVWRGDRFELKKGKLTRAGR